jgi:hypothetical protein
VEELVKRAHVDERYAREWLSEMASADYLAYDPTSQRFTLPPEHVPVLAEEGGPLFLDGAHQMFMAEIGSFNQLIQAFRQGGGVPMEAYGPDLWEGQARFSGGFFEHLLAQVWLPAMPEVLAKLERGALVADVGCVGGRALIKLAQSYPQSRYVGYDVFATFDVVHDAVSPLRLLRAIRWGLRPDGRYICMEAKGSDELTERIRLGTDVTCIYYRHPAMVARLAADLDNLSRGRLILGLGCGWDANEVRQFRDAFPAITRTAESPGGGDHHHKEHDT